MNGFIGKHCMRKYGLIMERNPFQLDKAFLFDVQYCFTENESGCMFLKLKNYTLLIFLQPTKCVYQQSMKGKNRRFKNESGE